MRKGARDVHTRRRLGPLFVVLLAAAAAASGCGGSSGGASHSASGTAVTSARTTPAGPPPRPVAHLIVRAPKHLSSSWQVIAGVRGQPGAWIGERSGVTLMRFDQHLVHLNLHSGVSDGGPGGSVFGDRISRREIHLLIAGFNGGFKLTYKEVGFKSGPHVDAPIRDGLGSIVTYTDGTTDIGAWGEGVPSASRSVFSVLQNQHLLVDRGSAAATVNGCVISCWGETVGSVTVVARSGLGVTADGQLVWAGGQQLSPAGLASALIGAGAVRAVELDINPDWVAGYIYPHHSTGPVAVQAMPGQLGIAGKLLEPDARDFMAIVAN